MQHGTAGVLSYIPTEVPGLINFSVQLSEALKCLLSSFSEVKFGLVRVVDKN